MAGYTYKLCHIRTILGLLTSVVDLYLLGETKEKKKNDVQDSNMFWKLSTLEIIIIYRFLCCFERFFFYCFLT